jgi:hypothetical protein
VGRLRDRANDGTGTLVAPCAQAGAAACYVHSMKSAKNGSRNGAQKAARPRATPRQQAARKKYLQLTGTKVSQERIAAIRAQWEG